MSEKKYGVLYRAKAGTALKDHYVRLFPSTKNNTITVMTRDVTDSPMFATRMSLDEAARVAEKWNTFDFRMLPAQIVRLSTGPEEVIDEEEALQYPDAISLELRAEAVRLQPDEKAVLDHLTALWNAYLALSPKLDLSHPDPHAIVRDAVHAIQGVIAMRVARRVDPDVWR